VRHEADAKGAGLTGDPAAGTAPGAAPVDLPEGLVTFLLTDIEDSTRLWDVAPRAMSQALARHEQLVAETVATHAGRLLKARGEGDATLSVFAKAGTAAAAAVALQRALSTEPWAEGLTLSTRVALHTGCPAGD
jgi:class 3 adenylate cyclase